MNIRLAYNFLIVHINPLKRQEIYTILSKSTDSFIAKYKSLYKEQNYKLVFSDVALFQIADNLLDRNLDIIDVDIVCREFIYDILFELPIINNVKSCIITKNVVNGIAKPIIKA